MKRFFDLSLLILIPFLFVGQLTNKSTSDPNPPEISEQAKEIHQLIAKHIDMSLEDIQKAIDRSKEAIEAGSCTLSCNPPNCCYTQAYLDRMIFEYGCCIADGNCPYPCLDLNGSGCVNGADLLILLQNWCTN